RDENVPQLVVEHDGIPLGWRGEHEVGDATAELVLGDEEAFGRERRRIDALEPAVAGAEDVPRFGDDELPGPRLADDSRRVTKRVRAGELDCADHRVGGRVEHDEPTPA